tara:strand:+ start:269 stop:607 length:339 start_codon:yes stop_codon:yes gene_type:complete
MRKFCSIIGVLFCVVSRLRNQCLVCDAIATKFVRDDFTGYATCLEESLEKSLEESFRCIGVSSLLSVDVDNFAILIDGALHGALRGALRGALKVMLFAGYLDKYLAQETGIA